MHADRCELASNNPCSCLRLPLAVKALTVQSSESWNHSACHVMRIYDDVGLSVEQVLTGEQLGVMESLACTQLGDMQALCRGLARKEGILMDAEMLHACQNTSHEIGP